MSDWSDLAIVTAMVLFLVALIAHAVEWGAARTVTAGAVRTARPASRAGGTAERRQRSLATVGASVGDDEVPGDPVLDGADNRSGQGREDDGPAAEVSTKTRDRRVELFGRLGLNIAVIATACSLLGVVLRGVAAQRAPWGNMYEFTISAVTVIALAYLVMGFRFGMRWIGLPVTLVLSLALGLSVTVLHVDVAPLVPALNSVWFIIHIAAATVAGAAFNLGAAASVLYLIRARMERKGRVTGYFTRMPTAAKLDIIAYRLHAFAFPLWTFAVAAGAVWAQYAWGRFWGWDPKETWALVTWVIYAGYLHARVTAGWKGTRATVIAVIGVASFWFNFFGVNMLFSGLHSYAGI